MAAEGIAAVALLVAGDDFGDVFGLNNCAGGDIVILHKTGHVSDGLGGSVIESGKVDLLMREFRRPSLDPACALAVVIDAVGVVAAVELIGFLELVPVAVQEVEIAGCADVIGYGHDEEWGRVGCGVLVAKRCPGEVSVQIVCGERELVHDFAVRTLAFGEKFQSLLGEGLVSVAVNCVKGPEGVSAEVPAEAGACGVEGGIPACDQADFVAGTYLCLVDSDFGPPNSLVEV